MRILYLPLGRSTFCMEIIVQHVTGIAQNVQKLLVSAQILHTVRNMLRQEKSAAVAMLAGFESHYAVGYGHWAAALSEWASLAGIEVVSQHG